MRRTWFLQAQRGAHSCEIELDPLRNPVQVILTAQLPMPRRSNSSSAHTKRAHIVPVAQNDNRLMQTTEIKDETVRGKIDFKGEWGIIGHSAVAPVNGLIQRSSPCPMGGHVLSFVHRFYNSHRQKVPELDLTLWRTPMRYRLTLNIFLTCFLVYLVFWSGHHYSIDGVLYFQYSKSLLFHQSFVMNPPVLWGYDFPVSKVPVGLSIAYIPVLAVLSLTVFRGNGEIRNIPYDPSNPYSPTLLSNDSFLYSSFLMPIITALTAVALFFLCRELGLSNKKAAAVSLLFGLASPAATYSKFDFAQPLGSFCLILTFLFLFKARRRAQINLILAGIFLGTTLLARPELGMVGALVFGTAALFITDLSIPESNQAITARLMHLLAITLPFLAFLAVNQFINLMKFGSWISVGYNTNSEVTTDLAAIANALVGNLVSPGRGIFLFFPISVLSLVGLPRLFQRERWAATVLGAFMLSSFFLYATWKDWGGGVSWGPRFFIPLMPYLAMLAVPAYEWLEQSPKSLRISLLTLLIALSCAATLQGLIVNFLDFYGGLHLSQQVIDQGNYNFLIENSPIIMGWNNVSDPRTYDIYWLRYIEATGDKVLLGLFAALLLAGLIARGWIDFFRASHSIGSSPV